MSPVSVSQARKNLYNLVDQVGESHEPLVIMGKRNSAVLLSSEDWKSIQETLYLLSVPGMRESLEEGRKTKLNKCATELNW